MARPSRTREAASRAHGHCQPRERSSARRCGGAKPARPRSSRHRRLPPRPTTIFARPHRPTLGRSPRKPGRSPPMHLRDGGGGKVCPDTQGIVSGAASLALERLSSDTSLRQCSEPSHVRHAFMSFTHLDEGVVSPSRCPSAFQGCVPVPHRIASGARSGATGASCAGHAEWGTSIWDNARCARPTHGRWLAAPAQSCCHSARSLQSCCLSGRPTSAICPLLCPSHLLSHSLMQFILLLQFLGLTCAP